MKDEAPPLRLDGSESLLLHPKRLVVASILYLEGEVEEASLQRRSGLSWGELDSALRRLQEAGLVETRKVITMRGPRTRVRLTAEGRRAYESLTRKLARLVGGGGGAPSSHSRRE